MVVPKIKFELMTIDEVVDVLSWSIFETDGALPLQEATFDLYPNLRENFNNLKKDNEDETRELIKKIIKNDYKIFSSNTELIRRYESIWNKYNDSYMNYLANYFGIEWEDEEIICKVGNIPVCPRFIRDKMFYICNMDVSNFIDTCMHEVLHFIFFEKIKTIFPNWKYSDFDKPALLWYLSEIVVDPILNMNGVQKIFKHKFKSYDIFYKVKFMDVILMDKIRDIFNTNNVVDSINISFKFLEENELSLRLQTNDDSVKNLLKIGR